MFNSRHLDSRGFTIVELLVVIVVIGILAAITIVSYAGITQKAIASTLQSDLNGSVKQIKLYQVTDSGGNYPSALDCSASPAASTVCLKSSGTNTYTYIVNNAVSPKIFTLIATNGNQSYKITESSTPVAYTPITPCPTGFIVVPGSSTYGTSDFCMMKYEAKNAGGNVPISQAAGTPWVNVFHSNAVTYSQNVAGCTGCHMANEAEWMTVIQNVLSVPSNWSGGAVGSGYIYSGHNDNNPSGAIAADSNDSNGYANTGNASGNQRRTLTLTNGEVIWDLAGNVWEYVNTTANCSFPGVTGSAYGEREWPNVTNPGSLAINPSPTATNISGASTWTSANGIGRLWSNADFCGGSMITFIRGGSWSNGADAGVLHMNLGWADGVALSYFGFRVAR